MLISRLSNMPNEVEFMPRKHFVIRVPDHGDAEINVMAVIFAALSMIDQDGRKRVMDFVDKRLAASWAAASTTGSPAA
jgi:hypothetical protein